MWWLLWACARSQCRPRPPRKVSVEEAQPKKERERENAKEAAAEEKKEERRVLLLCRSLPPQSTVAGSFSAATLSGKKQQLRQLLRRHQRRVKNGRVYCTLLSIPFFSTRAIPATTKAPNIAVPPPPYSVHRCDSLPLLILSQFYQSTINTLPALSSPLSLPSTNTVFTHRRHTFIVASCQLAHVVIYLHPFLCWNSKVRNYLLGCATLLCGQNSSGRQSQCPPWRPVCSYPPSSV